MIQRPGTPPESQRLPHPPKLTAPLRHAVGVQPMHDHLNPTGNLWHAVGEKPMQQPRKSTADFLHSFGQPSYLDFMQSRRHVLPTSPPRPQPEQRRHDPSSPTFRHPEMREPKEMQQSPKPKRRLLQKASSGGSNPPPQGPQQSPKPKRRLLPKTGSGRSNPPQPGPQPTLLPHKIPDAHTSRLGRKRKELGISDEDVKLTGGGRQD